MGELLIKPYEISVWEDKLIPIDGNDPVNYKFVENKIAVIGSNTMDGPNKVYDPIFNKKDNGEKTLTFSLKYKYFDPYSENEEVVNPFAALLLNERKVKLKYGVDEEGNDQWYDFIVKDHTESSDELTWTYTCTDAFVLELSKNGYNIEFSSDLNNNQGTAQELAKKTLEDTDWRLGGVDNFKQFIEEPIYKAILTSKTGVEIINATGDGKEVPDAGAQVYVFYSYIKNQNGKFVQFISQDESTYTIDDKNVITATNYRITTDLVFRDNGFYLGEAATPILSFGEVETKYHANRLAYGQLTTYDPVMERTVDRYRIGNSGEREVYNYTDYTYTTSSVVTNFITNGDNFNVLEDGTLQGWNPYTDVEGEKVNKLELVTWPELGTNKKLADISTLSQIEGFLKTKFSRPRKTINGKIYNTIYNSGFSDNASFIDAVSAGEQFVLRWRAGVGELGQLDNFDKLRVIVANYEQDQPTRFGYYYKHIKPEDIIIDFSKTDTIEVLNNYVEGGELVTDSEGKQNYVIDNVVQTPSTKYIYKVGNTEYVWNGETGEFIEYDDEANLYLPYNYMIGTADKAVSTKDLKDPENKKKIGIFLYTTDTNLTEDITINKSISIDEDEEEENSEIKISETIEQPIYGTNIVFTCGNHTFTCEAGTGVTETGDTYSFKYNEAKNTVTYTTTEMVESYSLTYKVPKPIYIQDIQLTRYIPDANNNPVLIGNIPTATSNPVDHFYLKPDEGVEADEVDIYNDAEELLKAIGAEEETLEPLYNENSEKNLSISVSQSNCFNALQTIAETFECWIDLVVDHDERGAIIEDDEGPRKFVYLKEYAGKDNYAGFKYAINLESIERNINSDEIVTKLIVNQSQSDYVDEGYVSIADAPSNPSGESYILNFDYYYNQGLLDRTTAEEDKGKFNEKISEYNKELKDLNTKLIQSQAAFTKAESKRNVFTELVDTAKEQKSEALAEFEELTGQTYDEYREEHNNNLTDDTKVPLDNTQYFPTNGESLQIIPYQMTEEEIELNSEGKLQVSVSINANRRDAQVSYTIQNNQIIIEVETYEDTYEEHVVTLKTFATVEEETPEQKAARENQQLTEEETILEILGKIYVTSATINNYGGLLSNIEQEYWDLKYQIDGYESYTLKIWVDRDEQNRRHVFVELNDYLPKIRFHIGSHECKTSVNKKYFEIITDDTSFGFDELPEGYRAEETEYIINDSLIKKIKINLTSNQSKIGLKEEIDNIIDEKTAYIKDFNNKYSRFIQEGTWNSTDYIDSELYYLDALQVSNTSAQPAVSYTVNVVEISQLDGYEWYLFDAGDKTYIEDTEFFGWANKDGVLTPAREEVIVSEVEWHLDAPDQNVITVRNYKTRFEDLFQRISAAVQTVQYNEATYAKISSLMDADGTINQDVLLTSLNRISGKQYNLTSDGSVVINGDNIIVQNLTNGQNLVKISSEGIGISSDGGNTWRTAIDGQGINIGVVYTGILNTDKVVIGGKNPSFRWDQSGISAYKSKEDNSYDMQTYVRYDEYGLYGIKDGQQFKAKNLQEVLDKAHFAVTWDGFFIKNSYTGGGKVQITSDNDFQVINSDQTEKIKIGALEWTVDGVKTTTPVDGVVPSLYGIRINNNAGDTVFKTGDDGNLEITGTIYANAGEIGGMSVDNNRLRMDHIVFEPGTGIYSDWGNTSVPPFIISDVNGSATFNSVIVRGSIKTSVFEYEEIQAVGGAFMFRPSTAIRTAIADGGDLILTVEKPLILRDGAWYKLSNYNSDETIDADELTTYGLTHIYQLSKTKVGNKTEIRLIGAAAILQTINIDDIPGGSIIDMGFEPNTYRPIKLIAESSPVALHLYELVNNEYVLTTDIEVIPNKTYYKEWYQKGINNYGIGINSSDNYINLPPRAISLFETIVNHEQDPKVSYNYRGILGTLPQMQYSGDNPQVSEYYHNYLEGTQGIYTDNMYIGDNNQYITFYEDDNGKKQLRIKANQIMFEIADPEPGEDPWQDIADIEAEGTPGPAGKDAIRVAIESNVGNEFIMSREVATLTCTVYRGATDVTSQVTKFLWIKNQANGEPDTTWNIAHEDYNLPYIEVTPSEINKKAVFGCRVTLPE